MRRQSYQGWEQTKSKAALFGKLGGLHRQSSEQERKDRKDKPGKAGRGQITQDFVRNIKEAEFYSKYYGTPLVSLM